MCEVLSHCGFDSIFLIICDVDHLFMSLWAIKCHVGKISIYILGPKCSPILIFLTNLKILSETSHLWCALRGRGGC